MQRLGGTSVARVDDFSGEPPPWWALGGSVGVGAPGATPHVPGAWVELDPATTEAYDGFDLILSYNTAGSQYRFMLEIAVGAAASEVIIAGPLGFGHMASYKDAGANVFIPTFIPRGSRISARFRLSAAWPGSEHPSINVCIIGHRANGIIQRFGLMATSSIDAANTDGAVDLPGAYGASSWFELATATTFRVRYLLVNLIPNVANESGVMRLLRLGTGAASSEQEFIQFQTYMRNTPFVPIACDIAAGTRIALQYWSTSSGGMGSAGLHLFG